MQHTGAVAYVRRQETARLLNPSLPPPTRHTDAGYLGVHSASMCTLNDPVISFVSGRSLYLQIC